MNINIAKCCYPMGSRFKMRALPVNVGKALVNFAVASPDGGKVKVNGKEYKLIHVSYNTVWSSLSIYFLTDHGQKLVRVSDHWCGKTSSGVNHCLSIKGSKWSIDQMLPFTLPAGRLPVYGSKSRNFAGGIVSLRKIKLYFK